MFAHHIGHNRLLDLQPGETLLARQMHFVGGGWRDEDNSVLARLQHVRNDQLCVGNVGENEENIGRWILLQNEQIE